MTIFNFFFKIIFLLFPFAQNIEGWYTLEPPQFSGSNEYLQSMF